MKGIRQILFAAIVVMTPLQQVLADPFIEGSEDSSSRFHSHLDDFGRSLGDSGQRMRESYDYSASQQAQRNLADQISIQQGTHAMSQQEFQKGMIQSQMSGGQYNGNSGGFVNNGGLFGSGIGAGGAAFAIAPQSAPSIPSGYAQAQPVYVPVYVPVPAAVPAARSRTPLTSGSSSNNNDFFLNANDFHHIPHSNDLSQKDSSLGHSNPSAFDSNSSLNSGSSSLFPPPK